MDNIIIEIPDGTSQGVANLVKKFANLSADLIEADGVQDSAERMALFIGVCTEKYDICSVESAVKLAQSK